MKEKNIVVLTSEEGNIETINGKSVLKWSYDDGIQALTEAEASLLASITGGHAETIKDHNVYFANVGGYFEHVALVYKDGMHIYYASDTEIHYRKYGYNEAGERTTEKYSEDELHKKFVDKLNNILFTDAELMQDVKNYNEYTRKDHFLRNYWILRYDYKSAFFINSSKKAEEEFKKTLKGYNYYNPVSFCYMKEKDPIFSQLKIANHLKNEYKLLLEDNEKFRSAIRHELWNHEACISYEYEDALATMGLSFNNLSDEKKQIVINELDACIREYANGDY